MKAVTVVWSGILLLALACALMVGLLLAAFKLRQVLVQEVTGYSKLDTKQVGLDATAALRVSQE